ncbi:MAG: class I SAM-dependent methyltransferase [Candidatus Taylorbacteria bacterium]|nr:class I SAM-dependent methyltransferase [Candidatus Taylorbacteria bacterium]
MARIPIKELKKDIVLKTTLCGTPFTFHTTWGLFSPEKIDEGTMALLEHVVVKEGDAILDLGCGYGALGIPLAKLASGGTTHMVDKDFVAVEYAEKNALLNNVKNVEVYLSNGFDQVPRDTRFDTIVSNLPAKISKEFFWILFEEARQRLSPGGTFYAVTIAGLRRFVERNFKTIFGNYELLASKGTYFVAKAQNNS